MKNEFFKDTRLLESLEYIESDLIGEVAEKLRVEGASDKMKAVNTKKSRFKALRQVAAIAACALLMGALIPVASYVSGSVTNLLAGSGASEENPEVLEPEPETSYEIIEETEPVVDEHGTPGLLYMVNEDGMTASFIGFGDCTEENVYIASVYEDLPVTRMIIWEIEEQQNRAEALLEENSDDYKDYPREVVETLFGEDFDNPYIKSITISDTIEEVGYEVINTCSNIERIHIGASVKELHSIYFNGDRGQHFSEITVSPENEYYVVKGNCLIRLEDKTLILGLKDAVIPDDGSVERIANVAFYNRPGLTSVIVPEGVTEIGGMAFAVNEDLVSISLPASIRRMMPSTIVGTPSLTEVKYAGTAAQWNTLICTKWIRDTALEQVICSDGVVELEFDERGYAK